MRLCLTAAILVLLAPSAAQASATASPNIMLVSIDGLRFDRTTMGGNEALTTPNLQAIANEAVVFTQAFSQSNESMYSHASMLTGRMPSEIAQAEYLQFVVPPSALTLAEALKDIGYQTGGFLAGGHVRANFGFSQGFDTVEESSDFGSFFETTPMALRWINTTQSDQAWFAFVHGYDCHRPYAKRGVFWHVFDADYRGLIDNLARSRQETERIFGRVYYPKANLQRVWHTNGVSMMDPSFYGKLERGEVEGLGNGVPLNNDDLKHLKAHYDSGVLVADTYVGLMLDQLKRTGQWENTLVIITSDHGEDLQDHGFTNHRAVLYDSTTHVPFMITGGALPETLHGTQVDAVVDSLDIVPTVMAMAGTVAPAKAKGRDLWGAITSGKTLGNHSALQQGVLGQTSLRNSTHRLTFHGLLLTDPTYITVLKNAPLNADHFALHEIASDPQEQVNLIESHPETGTQMRAEMLQRVLALEAAKEKTKLDAEAMKMLREHGYW